MVDKTQPRTELPYLTTECPGVGGVIKRYDEDFVVEELPRYEASGLGTHIYFTIEKRGLTTPAAIRIIAKGLGRDPRDIGYAGLKDAHGVTRQMLSIEHVDPNRVEALELARIRVLSVTRHTNKLKLGHLAGNRFVIKIRGASGSALTLAEPIVSHLTSRGVPNYFGPQRFGVRGDNAEIGRAILRDDYNEAIALMLGRPGAIDHGDILQARKLFDAGDLAAASRAWPRDMKGPAKVCRVLHASGGDAQEALRAVDHSLRKLYVCSVQSELFNRVLSRRVGAIDRLETGDVAWKHRNGACFQVEDAAAEQPRCDAFEISPTGPLFGRKMKEAQAEPGRLEAEVMAEAGVERSQMRIRDGSKLDGARRPLRVVLTDPGIDAGKDEHGLYLRLTFTLAPGAYATSVTREVCKNISK